jgi:hypothetical protein
MKNNSFLLNQVHGSTVVKIATMDEYDAFLKRSTERKVPFFTHQVNAKKPTKIVPGPSRHASRINPKSPG